MIKESFHQFVDDFVSIKTEETTLMIDEDLSKWNVIFILHSSEARIFQGNFSLTLNTTSNMRRNKLEM